MRPRLLILRDAAKTPLLPSERNRAHPGMRWSVSAIAHLIFLRRLRMQPAPVMARCCGDWPMRLAEQFGELFGDGAAELFGVDDGDGAAIVARDVVADADRDQLDWRAGLDLLDDVAQMALQVVAGIDRQRGIVDRRAI